MSCEWINFAVYTLKKKVQCALDKPVRGLSLHDHKSIMANDEGGK